MAGLVPIEKDVIPMVLLVICISLTGLFSCGLAGYRAIMMVRGYQWFDWSIGEYASH